MSSLSAFFVSAILLGAGCHTNATSDEERSFKKAWAHTWCERQKQCDRAEHDRWQDDEDCIDNKADDADFNAYWGDLLCGRFDDEAGDACVKSMDKMDCDDWADEDWRDECRQTYDC